VPPVRFNVVLVVIDTLRFDRVNSSHMPNLCSLLRESVFFTNHYSEAIPTHPSFTTIFTGVSPLVHGIVCHAGSAQLSPWLPMLPKLLNVASRSSCSCTTGTPTPPTPR
jgi:arylsulfatase A-like enzyme